MNVFSRILLSTEGLTATITLNRPDKRNALNFALLEQLAEAVKRVTADPAQRILVLRGAGKVFCSGLDLAEAADAKRARACVERLEQTLHALASTRLVTIAAVQGAAIAGGAGLMSACDFAIATRDAKFGYPEVHRGLIPALIMTFLRRQVREREARELLLLGKSFDAAHACALGLLNRVVPDAEALEAEVRVLTHALLQGAPGAIAETKKLLRELWPSTLEEDLAAARKSHLSSRDSEEAREGIAAFNEKRPPSWVRDHDRARGGRA